MSFTLPPVDGRVLAVLGGGVLGRRIACAWAASGYDVVIRDPSPDQRKAAVQYCETSMPLYSDSTKRGTVRAVEDLKEAVEKAWLVIEAVPEILKLKISTFAELEKLAPSDAILCSNSSSYKSREMLGELQESTKRRVLNMHYYMPPQARIVELMTCGFTDKAIFPFLYEKLKEIRMSPYVARKESTGFIFNRLWAAIKREVLNILAEGVSTPTEIDEIFLQMFTGETGPVETMDRVGLDTVSFIEQHYIDEFGFPDKTVKFLQKYLDEGKLGFKSTKGGLLPPKHATRSADEPQVIVLDAGLATSNPMNAFSAGRILTGTSDTKSWQPLVTGQNIPDGVDFSASAGRLFWTNMGVPSQNDGAVFSCKLDGSDIKQIVPQGAIHTPKQLTIDHQNSKLYFSDREGLRVWRCNFDGSDLELLVQAGDWKDAAQMANQTNWCVGIAVCPSAGKFYWTQKGPSKGGKGRIFRANIDFPKGHDAKTRTDIEVLFQNLPEPIDLEIDEETNTLYWTDRGELPLGNSINRAKIDTIKPVEGNATSRPGSDYELVARGLHEAIGIKLDPKNRNMYVTDLGGSVYRFDMDGGNRKKLYEGGAFTGITLAYPSA
jgi:3-hydroxyacyl-CoA dehydrogenase/sugar lactone lactonase YvrE